MRRNNHATLFQVRDIIGNTYICSSDNYFASNPFERYVYDSYYAAVFEEGETDEYCLQTKGRDRRITGAVVGGSHSWGSSWGTPIGPVTSRCDFMRFLSQDCHTETVGNCGRYLPPRARRRASYVHAPLRRVRSASSTLSTSYRISTRCS